MTKEELIDHIKEMKRKDHGEIPDGVDGTMGCDCDMCYEYYKFNEDLDKIINYIQEL